MKFTPIDLQTWPRGQMFYYFSKMAPTGYSMTVSVDVTELRKTLREAKKKTACQKGKSFLTLPLRGDDTILLVKKERGIFPVNESSVSVRNLTKSFGNRKVVDDLSFDVRPGEVFALLGHNGAGKSTTIDLILGLKTPDGGSARILGMNAAQNRKKVFERVGVQLQNTRYQPNITVEEACIEYASLYTDPADYLRLLDGFGLDALRKSFVSRLSGGERQKLSVVLALIGNPEIVFLDELTTGLDVVARREVWRTLKQLKSRGLTIFLTTHYMEEAEALCDRVCIIKSGKKVLEGTIDEIVAASGQKNLEEAYLFFMGEEELL